jgi:hypothetical protein
MGLVEAAGMDYVWAIEFRPNDFGLAARYASD